ncbi:MAG: carotenoid oxygenase family protein [Deltaproteobacteria bacterium]|nr:carotenoid oxygenase family protein [Deltaproteobacteria bacterium]
MSAATTGAAAANPYLRPPFGPVQGEAEARDLRVIGELPRDLRGVYARNGPNARFQAAGAYHWFDGDGMVHAVSFRDGRADYRARYVQSDHFRAETEAGRALWTGLLEPVHTNPRGAPYKDTANTDLVVHDGRMLALWYISGVPVALDPDTLESLGPPGWARDQPFRVSAHAKVCPGTGELLFFDYGPRPPWMRYGVVSRGGRLTHLTEVALPGPRLPHDMAFTERYSVLMDLPVFHRADALAAGRWLIDYHPDLPARFGVLPRHSAGSEIRWFEAEPCYIYHVVNAWEDGDAIEMLACRTTSPLPAPDPADGPLARMMANLRLKARLHRYRFDLRTGQTTEAPVDDLVTEFPAIDQGRAGRPTRHAWLVSVADTPTLCFDGLVKYDLETGRSLTHRFGEGRFGSEAVFVPREGARAEDDGYVLSFVTDARDDTSAVVVLDGQDFEAPPLCTVELPRRVPLGFHACWAPAETA